MSEANLKVNGALNDEITAVNSRLDEINSSLMLSIRSLYAAYTTNPCEKSEWLSLMVERLVHNEQGARYLAVSLRQLQAKVVGGTSLQEIQELITTLASTIQMRAPLTNLGMEAASSLSDQWEKPIESDAVDESTDAKGAERG